MPHLSTSFTDRPTSEELLRAIIDSPYHDQLVARSADGTIIGAATLTTTMGVGAGRGVWLEDFVVDPTVQGAGVGGRLWDAMIAWCRTHQADKLCFTSRPSRTAAQAFYLKHGAIIRDTNFFKKTIE